MAASPFLAYLNLFNRNQGQNKKPPPDFSSDGGPTISNPPEDYTSEPLLLNLYYEQT